MSRVLVKVVDREPPRVGSDGQGLEALKDDETVRANRPYGSYKKHGFDTAHLTRYNGTNFVQWVGRRRDGYFHPWGSLMRITAAGLRALNPTRPASVTPAPATTAVPLEHSAHE